MVITSDTKQAGRLRAAAIERLAERYNPELFDLERPQARLRIEGFGPDAADVVIALSF